MTASRAGRTPVDAVIVTCDQLPLPPLNGSSKKVHDMLHGLAGPVPVHALVYPENPNECDALRRYWRGRGIEFHALQRRSFARRTRSILSMRSVPTATRDFAGEATLIGRLMTAYVSPRLIIDFISGAPLVSWFSQGVVISGHDCMSYLFGEEARRAATWREHARFRLRQHHARLAERTYYAKANIVHVVSDNDATQLHCIDAAIRTAVIPLASQVPTEATLLPPAARKGTLVWGNLNSPVILAGVRELIGAAGRSGVSLSGWTLLGRVPAEAAAEMLPGLGSTGLIYRDSVECVSDVLGHTAAVVLPDLGGTGQKNRTLDALAHGTCVIGLAEVFRGIEPRGQFVEVSSFDEALTFLTQRPAADIADVGARARAFASTLDVHQRGEQWRALLASIPPLAMAA